MHFHVDVCWLLRITWILFELHRALRRSWSQRLSNLGSALLCFQRQHSVLAPELWQLHCSGNWCREGLGPLLWHLPLLVFIIIWWILCGLCEGIRKFNFQFLHADLSCRGHQLKGPSSWGRLDRTLSSSQGRREAWGSHKRHCPHPTHSVGGGFCSTPLLILCFSLYLIHTHN